MSRNRGRYAGGDVSELSEIAQGAGRRRRSSRHMPELPIAVRDPVRDAIDASGETGRSAFVSACVPPSAKA